MEGIIGYKDSVIQRLMGKVSSLKQSLKLPQEIRGQLQARSAASGANQIAKAEDEAPVPVRQSVQPVVSETSKFNQANLEAIQSLSVQIVNQVRPIYIAGMVLVARFVPERTYLFYLRRGHDDRFGGDPGGDELMRREMMTKS